MIRRWLFPLLALLIAASPASAKLQLNQLQGFWVNGGVNSITFTASAEDDTDLTTYDQAAFDGLSFGAAAADRHIIVGIGARANAARSISSVTIGGVTAAVVSDGVTSAVGNDTGGGADIAALYIAAVPSGTTGDVVVVFSGAMLRCGIAVFRMVGAASATAHQVLVDLTPTGNVLSVALDIPAKGGAIGMSWHNASPGTASATWAGLTERVDSQPETASNGYSGASDNFASVQTNLTVSMTSDGTIAEGTALVTASWGP